MYLTKVVRLQLDTEAPAWRRLTDLSELRNQFVHGGAFFDTPRGRKVATLVRRLDHVEFSDQEENGIWLGPGFLAYAIATSSDVVGRIEAAARGR